VNRKKAQLSQLIAWSFGST